MRAVVYAKHGGVDETKLVEHPEPDMSPNRILVGGIASGSIHSTTALETEKWVPWPGFPDRGYRIRLCGYGARNRRCSDGCKRRRRRHA